MMNDDVVTVCDKCLRAACYQNLIVCMDRLCSDACERKMTVEALRKIGPREHEDFWEVERV